MLFRVPDDITDNTRSLEMVERYRLIYWIIVFGHWKCFGMYRVHIGVMGGGLPEPLGEDMGHMGLSGKEKGLP